MRPDAWSPRTWLLAVLAGWSVLVALLGLFGMGGRIDPLPADPALVARLPRLPPVPPDRLGALPQYAEIGARPLFSQNRQPQPFFVSGQGEVAAPGFDMVLSSVLITPSLQLAIVQPAQGGEGVRVKVGEAPEGFPGWRLAELEARRAVFEGPEGRRELALRVFDGTGGQPPTPVVTPAPASGMPPVPVPAQVAPPDGAARTTGGNAAPTVTPAPAQSVKPATPPAAAEPPAVSTEEQMEAIRQRIEARRAQLRQQQAQPTPPPAPPGQTQ